MTPEATSSAAAVVVELRGVYDIARAREFHAQALEWCKSTGDLVLDCAGAERTDTSAVQILLALKGAVEQSGRKFELRNVPDPVLTFWTSIGAAVLLGVWREGI